MRVNLGSQLLMGLGLATAVLLVGTGIAHAQRWDDRCASVMERDQDAVRHAVDRYGYDSPQAQHERNELQTDARNCGYSGSSTYDDRYRNNGGGDRDDRWRNEVRNDDRSSSYRSPAYDVGYRDGVAIGQKDSQKGKSFRPQKNDRYEDADNGYNKSYGDKNQYKSLYREGFQRGYSDGYRQWR